MSKALNKWFRKIHRWLVWPFILLLVIILFNRHTDAGEIFQRIQAPLMIIMAITGAFLWLSPYLAKRQRNQRKSQPPAISKTNEV